MSHWCKPRVLPRWPFPVSSYPGRGVGQPPRAHCGEASGIGMMATSLTVTRWLVLCPQTARLAKEPPLLLGTGFDLDHSNGSSKAGTNSTPWALSILGIDLPGAAVGKRLRQTRASSHL